MTTPLIDHATLNQLTRSDMHIYPITEQTPSPVKSPACTPHHATPREPAAASLSLLRAACGNAFELAEAGEIALVALGVDGRDDMSALAATCDALIRSATRSARLLEASAANVRAGERRVYEQRAERLHKVIARLHGLACDCRRTGVTS